MVVQNGIKLPVPLWDGEIEVLNTGDLGLMSVAVDPAFPINHRIYLLYTVDPDSNGVDSDPSGFGRLVRYQTSVSDSNVVDPATRTVLMGATWTEGPLTAALSHTVGALRWGRDGSLLVSVGEGATSGGVDQGGLDPDAFGPGKTNPSEDIGAFRSQDLSSLCGKILRLDPENGRGYPSNPYADTVLTATRAKVWARGFRNPFRFAVRPGTGATDPSAGDPGDLYVSDVGWYTWEEISLVDSAGLDFGWPCYEGKHDNVGYQVATPPHHGCGTLAAPPYPAVFRQPLVEWSHTDSAAGTPPGMIGNSAIIGTFYEGDRYPAAYHGVLFFADFGHEWLKIATVGPSGTLTSITDFADDLDGLVDFAVHPATGDIYYVLIQTQRIQHIRFDPVLADLPPVAHAGGTPLLGEAPLTVSFSSAGSSDPEGTPLGYFWSFGDNTTSIQPNPVHVYAAIGTYDAVLAVTDGVGHVGQDTVTIIAHGPGPFPAAGVVDNFNRPDGPVGGQWMGEIDAVVLRSGALDPPGGYRSMVWSGESFGPDQEVSVRLSAITPTATDHDLMLKIQGTSWTAGHIEVRYDATVHRVVISTYTPGVGWAQRGLITGVTFVVGDRFGARAFEDGKIEVYRNGTKIGTASATSWPFRAAGGRIGLTVGGAGASLLDDFGGGSFATGPNQPPEAGITWPTHESFVARGDTVRFQGTASDLEDHPGELQWQWRVDLLHNNHVHPSFFVSSSTSPFFVMDVHDDGTGVRYLVRLIVTDTGGARDTASITLYPEVDLHPSWASILPVPPAADAPVTFRFRVHNTGGMPSPFAHWILYDGWSAIAQGDTLCPAHDSVLVQRTVAAGLAPGWHTFRVALDTTDVVFEPNDEDNGAGITALLANHAIDGAPPALVSGPTLKPSGTNVVMHWATNEWATGRVRYGPSVSLGDTVLVPADTAQTVTLTGLTLDTRYYFRIRMEDPHGNWVETPLDSFKTVIGPLDAGLGATGGFALSAAYPNPSRGAVELAIVLPAPARIGFSVHDLQGRVVWKAGDVVREAGRWNLRWPGSTSRGTRAAPGLYHARIQVDGRVYLRRIALLR